MLLPNNNNILWAAALFQRSKNRKLRIPIYFLCLYLNIVYYMLFLFLDKCLDRLLLYSSYVVVYVRNFHFNIILAEPNKLLKKNKKPRKQQMPKPNKKK